MIARFRRNRSESDDQAGEVEQAAGGPTSADPRRGAGSGSAEGAGAGRWPIIFVIVGLLAAGIAYDEVSAVPPGGQTTEADQVVVSPSMGEPPRLDGAWYCPVGSSAPGGFADHEVYISNLSDEPAIANLSILTGEGPGPGRRIELPPRSTERVQLSETQLADVAGAVVEIIGGRGVVGHSVETEQGVAEGPCATHAASTWYFASGRTSRDSTQYLALMNPFPENAVFDVEFQAVGRSREPETLQGAFVEARSIKLIDVGDFVRREELLATKITTARGRLVVERLQLVNGDLGPSGAALQLGVPTPSPSWIFTAGRIQSSGDDRLTIFNPNEPAEIDLADIDVDLDPDDEAAEDSATTTVAVDADGNPIDPADPSVDTAEEESREGFVDIEVRLWPSNPTDLSEYSVVTIEREIRPGNFVTIDLRAQAERFDFPLPYELGVDVVSVNGLPVVAERWQFAEQLEADALESPTPTPEGEGEEGLQPPEIVADPGTQLPQPIATAGISTSRGHERLSNRWVVPWVTMDGPESTLIAIASPDEAAVEVSVLSGGQLNGPLRVVVPAGGRAIVPVSAPLGGAPVEIIADVPVSVEAMVVLPGESLDVVPAVPTVAN